MKLLKWTQRKLWWKSVGKLQKCSSKNSYNCSVENRLQCFDIMFWRVSFGDEMKLKIVIEASSLIVFKFDNLVLYFGLFISNYSFRFVLFCFNIQNVKLKLTKCKHEIVLKISHQVRQQYLKCTIICWKNYVSVFIKLKGHKWINYTSSFKIITYLSFDSFNSLHLMITLFMTIPQITEKNAVCMKILSRLPIQFGTILGCICILFACIHLRYVFAENLFNFHIFYCTKSSKWSILLISIEIE